MKANATKIITSALIAGSLLIGSGSSAQAQTKEEILASIQGQLNAFRSGATKSRKPKVALPKRIKVVKKVDPYRAALLARIKKEESSRKSYRAVTRRRSAPTTANGFVRAERRNLEDVEHEVYELKQEIEELEDAYGDNSSEIYDLETTIEEKLDDYEDGLTSRARRFARGRSVSARSLSYKVMRHSEYR